MSRQTFKEANRASGMEKIQLFINTQQTVIKQIKHKNLSFVASADSYAW